MKQTINLLPLKPKEVANFLGFNMFLSSVGICFIICSSIAAYLWWQTGALEADFQQRRVANLAVQTEIVKNTETMAKRAVPSALTLQLTQLQQQIKAMQQMLELSVATSAQQDYVLVNLINTLQQSMPANSLLESFKVESHGKFSAITGTTEHLEKLPLILKNLRDHGLLKNQDISKIRALRSAENHKFEILFAEQEADQ
jgi:hypothetical protein